VPHVVREYALAMRSGAWRPTSMLVFAVYEDRRYLIGGLQRLHAVVEANLPVRFRLKEIHVDAYEAIADEFDRIDRRWQQRLDQALKG
jgi:hypothetical protein